MKQFSTEGRGGKYDRRANQREGRETDSKHSFADNMLGAIDFFAEPIRPVAPFTALSRGGQTSHTSKACRSDATGSFDVGMNSWAMNPW